MADSRPIDKASAQQLQVLKAEYHSPTTESWTLCEQLPVPPIATETTPDNSIYLRDLREKLSAMQQQINEKLTAQMEEDKAREATVSNGTKRKLDEANEEDNYGEEVQEEDD